MTLGSLLHEETKLASVNTEGGYVPLPSFQIDNFSEFRLAIYVEAIAITGISFAGCEVQVIFHPGTANEAINSSSKLLNSQYKELIIPQVVESFSIRFSIPTWIKQITVKFYKIVDQSNPQVILEERITELESEIQFLRGMLTHHASGMLAFSSGNPDAPISWRRPTMLDIPSPLSKMGGLFKADFPGVTLALDETTGLNSIADPATDKLLCCGLGRGSYEMGSQVNEQSAVKCERKNGNLPHLVFDGEKDGLALPLVVGIRTIAVVLSPTDFPSAFCPILGLSTGQGWHCDSNYWLRSEESQSGFTSGSWWFNGELKNPAQKTIVSGKVVAILIQTDSPVQLDRVFCDRDAAGRYFPGKLYCLYFGVKSLTGEEIGASLAWMEGIRNRI